MARKPSPSWSIDKHIPVALIFAIAAQTGGALWWASKVDSRVSALETQNAGQVQLFERVVKVEEKLTAVKDQVRDGFADIKQRLDERRK